MTSSLDMIRGRSNVVTLTNSSGGALVAGDVCILNTGADESATTTTSANSTSKVYIAAESIGIGATGKFYSAGFCPLVTPSASVTRGRYLFTHTVAKQAAESATYGSGAFGVILKSGTTPSVWLFGSTAQGTGGTFGGTTGSTDNAILRADGTGGATIQSSLATVDDSGTVNIPTGQTYNINNTPHTHAGGAGALILLEEHAGSGASTPTLNFTTCISATYDDYLIEFVNIIPATTGQNFVMRAKVNGSYDNTAKYQYIGWYNGNADVFTSIGSVNDTSMRIAQAVSTQAGYSLNGWMKLHGPGSSSLYKATLSEVVSPVGTGNAYMWHVGGFYYVTTAMNAFQFFFASGDVASGTIRVYGVAKS